MKKMKSLFWIIIGIILIVCFIAFQLFGIVDLFSSIASASAGTLTLVVIVTVIIIVSVKNEI